MSLTDIAHQREALHAGRHPSNNARVAGVDLIGLAGEKAFGAIWGVEPDYTPRVEGDKGIDFWAYCVTPRGDRMFMVDVKTSRPESPCNLLVEAGDLRNGRGADIFVQARYLGGEDAECLGWQWRSQVMAAPARLWHPNGKHSHRVLVAELRPMSELIDRVLRVEARKE